MEVWIETSDIILTAIGFHDYTKTSITWPFFVAIRMWFPLGRILIDTTISTIDSVYSVLSLPTGFTSSIPECTKHLPSNFDEERSKNLK